MSNLIGAMELGPELTFAGALSSEEGVLLGGVMRAKQWVANLAFERRYGANTAGLIEPDELGIELEGAYRYEPSGWLTLPAALTRREAGREDVLVDLGCGMGRVVLQAARRYRLKRVVGVELSPELAELARRNVARQRRLRTHDVEIVQADAASWSLPEDATIVYMHNPFLGDLFGRVLERLVEHVDRSGRPLELIYLNPVEKEQVEATGRAREVALPNTLIGRIGRTARSGRVRRYQLLPSA